VIRRRARASVYRVAELADEGLSAAAIASTVQLPEQTVTEILDALGLSGEGEARRHAS
jgi:hypothetical protein